MIDLEPQLGQLDPLEQKLGPAIVNNDVTHPFSYLAAGASFAEAAFEVYGSDGFQRLVSHEPSEGLFDYLFAHALIQHEGHNILGVPDEVVQEGLRARTWKILRAGGVLVMAASIAGLEEDEVEDGLRLLQPGDPIYDRTVAALPDAHGEAAHLVELTGQIVSHYSLAPLRSYHVMALAGVRAGPFAGLNPNQAREAVIPYVEAALKAGYAKHGVGDNPKAQAVIRALTVPGLDPSFVPEHP